MRIKRIFLVILILSLFLGCSNNNNDEMDPSIKRIGKNLKEPPSLTIAIGEQTIRAVKGSYSWSYFDGKAEEVTSVEADTAPPPELVNIADATTVHADAEVGLLFDYAPDDYNVRVWNTEKAIASYKNVELAAYEGNVIYEIEGKWEQGTASYAFTVNIE